MNKTEFLQELEKRLHVLNEQERKDVLEEYAQHINLKIESGLSEEEAVEAVGSVDEIGAQTLREIPLSKLVKKKLRPDRRLRIWEIILLVLGSPVWVSLLAAAFVLFFTAYLFIWVAIAVLYSVHLAFIACAVGGIVSGFIFISSGSNAEAAVFMGLALMGAGIAVFMFLGCGEAAKALLRLSRGILPGIKSCFVGRSDVQ